MPSRNWKQWLCKLWGVSKVHCGLCENGEHQWYRKIPKRSLRAFWGAYFWRGLYSEGLIFGGAKLSMEGNLHVKADWASLIVGGKFTCFCFVLLCIWGQFPSTSPQGAYIWRGDLTQGFLHYEFGWLIFGGANAWRGLFSEFYDITYNCFYCIRVDFHFYTWNLFV